MRIRKMKLEDIEQVMEIEKSNFVLPWKKEEFVSDISKEYSFNYVLVNDKEIVGYIGCWMVLDYATMTNIAIKKEYQGKHLSNKLMLYLLNICNKKNICSIDLEVRTSNNVAINLYKKYDFTVVRTIKNYYHDEDAYMMLKKLKEGEGYEKIYLSA